MSGVTKTFKKGLGVIDDVAFGGMLGISAGKKLSKSIKAPDPAATRSLPSVDSEQASAAAEQRRRAERAARGRLATRLTSPSDYVAPMIGTKTLLGQ